MTLFNDTFQWQCHFSMTIFNDTDLASHIIIYNIRNYEITQHIWYPNVTVPRFVWLSHGRTYFTCQKSEVLSVLNLINRIRY